MMETSVTILLAINYQQISGKNKGEKITKNRKRYSAEEYLLPIPPIRAD